MKSLKYCDYSCEHASFPPEDMLGACRTMAGVFCIKIGRMVPKHVPCRAVSSVEAEDKSDYPEEKHE